ncbi:MAG: hypothetical protein ACI8RZ_002530 [Myxococcota bacterium]|jgi:hypothetical protein
MHTIALLLLVACGPSASDSASGQPDTAPTWHADVHPIIEHSCVGCHTDDGIGGFSLTTFEAVSEWSIPVAESVASHTMPPWGAGDDCNSYQNDFSLTEQEIDTILLWVESGTPEGDPDTANTATPWQAPVLERVDATLELPIDYAPKTTPDDYRCFIIDWPYDETVWVTGYEVQPGNEAIVHHVIPFIIAPEDVDTFQALDEAESGEGYTCYGGPGGDIESFKTSKWLGPWAPGGGAFQLPEGLGIEVPPGSIMVTQVHYNSTGSEGTDRSLLNLQVETQPQKPVKFQPWADISWLMGDMEIPAQSEGIVHGVSYEAAEPFQLYASHVHMHSLGVSGRVSVKKADGSERCVLDVPDWDFNWQRNYLLEEPIQIEAGETVDLTCAWDNPTDQDVNWGEGTSDEMCLMIMLKDE